MQVQLHSPADKYQQEFDTYSDSNQNAQAPIIKKFRLNMISTE